VEALAKEIQSAGDTAYYPEKLLKNSRVIAAARAVAHERTSKIQDSLP
jgi:hypothetical protein